MRAKKTSPWVWVAIGAAAGVSAVISMVVAGALAEDYVRGQRRVQARPFTYAPWQGGG